MKQSSFRYNTIFMNGSLQSVGHTMDYFIEHTKKLLIHIIMPRVQGTHNLLRVYDKGALVEEKIIPSSSKFFLYYFLWWFYQQKFLLRYFSRIERVLVLTGHPIGLFGMSIMKQLRNVRYAYWIGDYFPPVNLSLILFEKLKKYYHDRVPSTYYLSDRINNIFNGNIVKLENKKTVMWGVKPYKGPKKQIISPFRLLFVGVVRPSQGIEDLLLYIKQTSKVELSIIGVCERALYDKYILLVKKYNISNRVWFPNKFVDEKELIKISASHHVGIALYEKGKDSATYYTDPGKVKTYIELGLPVIMSNTSSITSYIKKYNAGIVIDAISQLTSATLRIRNDYESFQQGIQAFSEYFDYEKYYSRSFIAFEYL